MYRWRLAKAASTASPTASRTVISSFLLQTNKTTSSTAGRRKVETEEARAEDLRGEELLRDLRVEGVEIRYDLDVVTPGHEPLPFDADT